MIQRGRLISRPFDIAVIARDDAYFIEVLPMREGEERLFVPLIPPFKLDELPSVREDAAEWVYQASTPRLRASREIAEKAKGFGTKLFMSLFHGEILERFRQRRRELRPDERLCIRLQLPLPLTLLPWELLYIPQEGYLVLENNLSLVRKTELPRAIEPLPIDEVLQIVVVLANPKSPDYETVKVRNEEESIRKALLPLGKRVNLQVIEGRSTLSKLREKFHHPVHILHILCHGELSEEDGEGVLIFEDSGGAPEKIRATVLAEHVQQQRDHCRLVMLNACLGALPVSDDRFSSVGASLIRGGIPAVVAMQFEMNMDSASSLTQAFYSELVNFIPVDIALLQARLRLKSEFQTRLDWVVPVLFMQSSNTQLFSAKPASPPLLPLAEAPPIIPSVFLDLLKNARQVKEPDLPTLALLAAAIEDPAIPLKERFEAAKLASRFGDPRPGVTSTAPQWSDEFARATYSLVYASGNVQLDTRSIALYPVTVAQYRKFITERGYRTEVWWTKEGWKQRLQRNWLQPERWKEDGFSSDNQPVVGVSWYEAVAYCNWLTDIGYREGWLESDDIIRLPIEAEWEIAAAYTTHRRSQPQPYAIDQNLLTQNTIEANIRAPSPVGLFPHGRSPCGAFDMAGNVWEWCSSEFNGYPPQSATDSNPADYEQVAVLVLRGGSYGTSAEQSGWQARKGNSPIARDRYRGFRVLRSRKRDK